MNVKSRRVLFVCFLLALWFITAVRLLHPLPAYAQPPSQGAPRVDVARIDGVIDTFTEGYVQRVLNVARDDGAEAVVFQLDTPGGQLDATRKIIEDFFDSPVPVIVYVSPSGARAGSAGVFITYGANLAAMAPGTNIGAAHPVDQSGQDITGTIGTKIENDSVAFIRSIANQRGRNADWAEDAVRKSVSVTEQEAKKLGVINLIATNMNDLLNQLDGQTVKLKSGDKTLHTAGAEVHQQDMNFFEDFFHVLLDPNIALILLNIGSLAILVELYNPGSIIPAVIGIICLTLAAVALFGLPTNWAAVILIIAALGMFVVDVKVNSIALTVGGIIAFALGAFFLFRPFTPPEPTAPELSVSPFVILCTVGVTAVFFLIVLRAAIRARRVPVVSGITPFIGATGVATTDLNPDGTVLVKSEGWSATAQDGPIHKGERVKVVAVDGLRMQVARLDPAPSPSGLK